MYLILPLIFHRTELCAFSEFRVYPGHGQKFIRRDGQPILLSTSKCKSLYHQRKKPAKLMWTQSWRRLNKKGKDEGVAKKKARKVVKAQRAIVGASIQQIRATQKEVKPKSAATEAALKEVKDRKAAAKKAASAPRGGNTVNIPKVQQRAGNARGGSKR